MIARYGLDALRWWFARDVHPTVDTAFSPERLVARAAGIAERCEVQVAYAIGIAHPMSVMVETFGTSTIDPEKLPALVQEHFDLRPAAIIERLKLRRPIFQRTAAYGHFGRAEPTFTWESTDHADALRKAAEDLA